MDATNNNINGSEKPELLQLHQYLEGRLDPTQRQTVEELLRVNAAARRTLDAMREEQKLIREALEVRAEPSRRLSDQVLFTLHAEERARAATARNRKLRRQFIAAAGMAAALAFCLWLVKPRDWAGMAQSGTVAAMLHRANGEVDKLKADVRLYEEDSISTPQGQYVRLKLYNGATMDLDEHSQLTAIKVGSSPVFRLESGRLGLNSLTANNASTIEVPEGSIHIDAGSRVDVWLPQPSHAVWPSRLDFEPKAIATLLNAAPPTAVVTVFKGTASFTNEKLVAGTTLAAGQRAVFTSSNWSVRNIDLANSNAMDARDERTWHSQRESAGPLDRSSIGLLDTVNFAEMGVRLKLTEKTNQGVLDALQALHQAMAQTKPEARAEKLAQGQSDLRRACEELDQLDDRRRYGRVLEGIAHLERGCAMASLNTEVANQTAKNAFEAAVVAFDEALRPLGAAPSAPIPEALWPKQLTSAGAAATMTDLSAENQAALIAAFHHAVAEYWQARMLPAEEARRIASNAAQEFSTLHGQIIRHTETLAAKYAQGLALGLAGEHDKSVEAFQDVLSIPLGGASENARRTADGIKQAVSVALVREHLRASDAKKAHDAAENFWILYPLDANGSVAGEIERATKPAEAPKAIPEEVKAGH